MNEVWIILHNRFVIDAGQAVSGKDASFDHLIRGNAFAIPPRPDPATPSIFEWQRNHKPLDEFTHNR